MNHTTNRCTSLLAILLCSVCLVSGATASDPPEKSPLEQVETMVHRNAGGLISITYADPWFWEVGYYAQSLWQAMITNLAAADRECRRLTTALTDNPKARLGQNTTFLFDSLTIKGEITSRHLISSLLTKYSLKNPVDPQSDDDKGRFTPLYGTVCNQPYTEELGSGLIQQMFPSPENNPEAYYAGKCEAIEQVRGCFNDLHVIDRLNRKRQGDGNFEDVEMDEGVFAVVSGEKS